MWLLFILFLTLGPSETAGEVPVDSLIVGMEPSEKIEFLGAEVQRTMRNDPRKALDLAILFLEEAKDTGDDRARYQALMDIGVARYYLGEYKEALRRYEQAMEVAVGLDQKLLIAGILNNIGILYYVWGEHDLALDYYLQGLTLNLETEDGSGVARSYNNIAAVHHTAGRYDSALEYYSLALAIYREAGPKALEAGTLNNIGLVRYDQEDYVEGIVDLEKALVLERELNDRPGEALSLNNLGMIFAKLGRLEEAENHFKSALEIRKEIGDRQGESVSLQFLGTALVSAGDVEAGIAMLEEALAIARDIEVQELIRDDLQALAEAWVKAGDHERALEYHQLFKAAHDRIFDEERAHQMAAAEARFELDLKDKEIVVLRREAEFMEFRRKIFIASAAGSILIMALLWNRYRFQKRANHNIKMKNEALQKAHSDLEEAAREELAHVARVATMGELTAAFAHELHQPLTAIMANVRTIRNLRGTQNEESDEPDVVLGYIREDADRAREIIKRLREMMQKGEVRRRVRDIDDVVRAGLRFIEPAARQQGILVRQELTGGLPFVRCDQIQLQQVLVNLVQNGLAAMQGQNGEITISTHRSGENQVMVRVRDDGPPVSPEVMNDMFDPFFTTKSEGLGMGLPICRTIIEAHGGTLSAKGNEEGGMTMEFDLSTSWEAES